MGNTNQKIVDKYQQILSDLGVGCFVYRSLRPNKKTPHAKPMLQAKTLGLKRCKKFLDIIHPYMTCRSEQVTTLKRFVEERLSKPEKTPIGPTEEALAAELRRLNSRSIFSETNTPNPSNNLGEDRVHAACESRG